MSQEIRSALRVDYNIPNVVRLTKKPLKWYLRLAVTDATHRRWVFNVGDFIRVRDFKARLTQCFTMVFRDLPSPLLFVIVEPVQAVRDPGDKGDILTDSVLGLPVYRVIHRQRVCGLPALGLERLQYFIDAPEEGPWLYFGDGEVGDERGDEEEEYVLECTWDIDSM